MHRLIYLLISFLLTATAWAAAVPAAMSAGQDDDDDEHVQKIEVKSQRHYDGIDISDHQKRIDWDEVAKDKNIKINGKGYGEDWNLFIELVQNSNLKDKDAIVNTVNNAPNKQKAVKDMCAIYPQLEKDILPQIRRAEVFVNEPTEVVTTKTVKVKRPKR